MGKKTKIMKLDYTILKIIPRKDYEKLMKKFIKRLKKQKARAKTRHI